MKKIIIAILITIIVIFALEKHITLELLKQNKDIFAIYFEQNHILVTTLFFLTYIGITALAIPGGALTMTILAGFLFGNAIGIILVSFASSIGATITFLISRYLFSDIFRKKFYKFYTKINKGISENGPLYLLSLRLSPIVPFWILNLVSGLTRMKVSTFYIVSQIGMFPLTVIIVNAGTQLNSINSIGDIITPNIIISLTLVGIFPLLAKWYFKKSQ